MPLAPSSSLKVWQGRYEMVLHFAPPVGLGAPQFTPDAAAPGNRGTLEGGAAIDPRGRTGAACRFGDSAASGVSFSTVDGLFGGWSRFSVSFWIWPDYASDAEWPGAGGTDEKFVLGTHGEAFSLGRLFLRNGKDKVFQVDPTFAGGTVHPQVGLEGLRWSHVVFVCDGSEIHRYRDGKELAGPVAVAGADSPLVAKSAGFHLGSYLGSDNSFRGRLDELRISKQAFSRAWVVTDHANQSDPDFVKKDPLEGPR